MNPKNILRIEQVDHDQPLTSTNCRLTMDGHEVEGVTRVVIAPIDANQPDFIKAEITAAVTLDLSVAVARDPWHELVVRELEELRRALCPAGCGAGIEPHTLPLDKGYHHAFGRCPAELIVTRLRALGKL